MISFKNYLTEARMAPLYHGTTFDFGCSILDNGFMPKTFHSKQKLLKATKYGDKYESIKGVSLTRSYDFAKRWAMHVASTNDSYSYLILELDQLALSRRYEIKPFQFWQGLRTARRQGSDIHNEFEEFVITENVIPPKYIKAVHYYISLQQGRNPAEAMQHANIMSEVLKSYQKDNPKIRFIAIRGGNTI